MVPISRLQPLGYLLICTYLGLLLLLNSTRSLQELFPRLNILNSPFAIREKPTNTIFPNPTHTSPLQNGVSPRTWLIQVCICYRVDYPCEPPQTLHRNLCVADLPNTEPFPHGPPFWGVVLSVPPCLRAKTLPTVLIKHKPNPTHPLIILFTPPSIVAEPPIWPYSPPNTYQFDKPKYPPLPWVNFSPLVVYKQPNPSPYKTEITAVLHKIKDVQTQPPPDPKIRRTSTAIIVRRSHQTWPQYSISLCYEQRKFPVQLPARPPPKQPLPPPIELIRWRTLVATPRCLIPGAPARWPLLPTPPTGPHPPLLHSLGDTTTFYAHHSPQCLSARLCTPPQFTRLLPNPPDLHPATHPTQPAALPAPDGLRAPTCAHHPPPAGDSRKDISPKFNSAPRPLVRGYRHSPSQTSRLVGWPHNGYLNFYSTVLIMSDPAPAPSSNPPLDVLEDVASLLGTAFDPNYNPGNQAESSDNQAESNPTTGGVEEQKTEDAPYMQPWGEKSLYGDLSQPIPIDFAAITGSCPEFDDEGNIKVVFFHITPSPMHPPFYQNYFPLHASIMHDPSEILYTPCPVPPLFVQVCPRLKPAPLLFHSTPSSMCSTFTHNYFPLHYIPHLTASPPYNPPVFLHSPCPISSLFVQVCPRPKLAPLWPAHPRISFYYAYCVLIFGLARLPPTSPLGFVLSSPDDPNGFCHPYLENLVYCNLVFHCPPPNHLTSRNLNCCVCPLLSLFVAALHCLPHPQLAVTVTYNGRNNAIQQAKPTLPSGADAALLYQQWGVRLSPFLPVAGNDSGALRPGIKWLREVRDFHYGYTEVLVHPQRSVIAQGVAPANISHKGVTDDRLRYTLDSSRGRIVKPQLYLAGDTSVHSSRLWMRLSELAYGLFPFSIHVNWIPPPSSSKQPAGKKGAVFVICLPPPGSTGSDNAKQFFQKYCSDAQDIQSSLMGEHCSLRVYDKEKDARDRALAALEIQQVTEIAVHRETRFRRIQLCAPATSLTEQELRDLLPAEAHDVTASVSSSGVRSVFATMATASQAQFWQVEEEVKTLPDGNLLRRFLARPPKHIQRIFDKEERDRTATELRAARAIRDEHKLTLEEAKRRRMAVIRGAKAARVTTPKPPPQAASSVSAPPPAPGLSDEEKFRRYGPPPHTMHTHPPAPAPPSSAMYARAAGIGTTTGPKRARTTDRRA